MHCPNYHLKLSSNKMERHHIRNHLDRDGWEMDRQKWTNHLASSVTRFNLTGLFLVGLCKENLYQVKTNDLQHLKAHIRDAVAMVNTKHASSKVERGLILSEYLFVIPPRQLTLKFT
jgi:hypothetical protein